VQWRLGSAFAGWRKLAAVRHSVDTTTATGPLRFWLAPEIEAKPFTFTRKCILGEVSRQHRCFYLTAVGKNQRPNAGYDNTSRQDRMKHEGNSTAPTSYQYRPYTATPPTQQRVRIRDSAPFRVPESLKVPEDHASIEIGFVRSSGAGGQNVNKLSTQAQLRMHLPSASWLPLEVRTRIQQREGNRISKDGYLLLNAQEHRTQSMNKSAALDKLKNICLECYPRPKVRKLRKGPSKNQKEKRLQEKKSKSQKKENRKRIM
jgi:hypothetical protein